LWDARLGGQSCSLAIQGVRTTESPNYHARLAKFFELYSNAHYNYQSIYSVNPDVVSDLGLDPRPYALPHTQISYPSSHEDHDSTPKTS
jgi:hypothetical protein